MSECFLGEVRIFSGNYAPRNWALCNGQLLPIDQNEALYTLIGTTYGGDGHSTFGLPDLRGRVPIHQVAGTYPLGQSAGTESVALTTAQLPAHTHIASGQKTAGTSDNPANAFWAAGTANMYSTTNSGLVNMAPTAISSVGVSLPHENMMPFLTVSFIIATAGIFPSQQ